jgi:predicted TPR repeat methyltransferase
LDEALAIDSNSAKAWAAKGRLRESNGELMQAVQNYQQSLAINSNQPELFQRVSSLQVRMAQGGAATGSNLANNANGQPGSAGQPARY